MSAPSTARLARRLGTGDAVVIGLSAMIGAGIYSAFGPAAAAAGAGLVAALALAAVVATCNALSSAQLAAAYPASGGTYVYGREVLGPWWGFVAGWGFVVGKTASCAAMALTFAAYAVPGAGGAAGPATSPAAGGLVEPAGLAQRAVALAAVAALTFANVRGVTRTARVARVLLVVTVVALVGFVAVALGSGSGPGLAAVTWLPTAHDGALGVLQAAGLLFFAFAGYARVATLGEEVRRPDRIGRAVLAALAIVVVLYLGVGLGVLAVLGPSGVAATTTPVATAAGATGVGWLEPVVRVGATAATLGALLALLAGVGRTTLAMARERDLPAGLAAVDPRHQVPARAQGTVALAAGVLVVVADLRSAIGFSSFGVLVYYAVANLAALRQPRSARRHPRAVAVLGLVGCVVLVATLPPVAVVAGLGVFAVGVSARLMRLRLGSRPRRP